MTTTKQPGFAPAASPHASTAVHTSDEHITAGETSIPSQGENMPAYHARPKNADGPLPIIGTPWILIGCYFTIALPFMYRAITNNLQAIHLHDLMDAAQLLGASTWQAALLVVLPNLRKGLMVALLLSFSFLFGEFVFANLLVGTRYETLQVYLNNMRNSSGHFNSALVISYFAFVLVLTWVANRLNKDKT